MLIDALHRARDAIGDRLADRGLERGAEVGDIADRQAARAGSHGVPHRRLQSGEREVRIVRGRASAAAAERRGLPARAACSTAGPPGIGEAEQLRRLVEGLAQRVVDRRRQPAIAPDRLDDRSCLWPPETSSIR